MPDATTPTDANVPPAITVFMLVKTLPEWLGFTVEERFRQLGEHVQPVLKKQAGSVRLRSYDVEFYSARRHRPLALGGGKPSRLSASGRGSARNTLLGPLLRHR